MGGGKGGPPDGPPGTALGGKGGAPGGNGGTKHRGLREYLLQSEGRGKTIVTHCLGIQVAGDPFQEGEPGRGDHPGDPLLLVAVAGGHQGLKAGGRVDGLRSVHFSVTLRRKEPRRTKSSWRRAKTRGQTKPGSIGGKVLGTKPKSAWRRAAS